MSQKISALKTVAKGFFDKIAQGLYATKIVRSLVRALSDLGLTAATAETELLREWSDEDRASRPRGNRRYPRSPQLPRFREGGLLTMRSCNVPNARSMRPFACGLLAQIISTFSANSARPTA
jgi:hypothetical protein